MHGSRYCRRDFSSRLHLASLRDDGRLHFSQECSKKKLGLRAPGISHEFKHCGASAGTRISVVLSSLSIRGVFCQDHPDNTTCSLCRLCFPELRRFVQAERYPQLCLRPQHSGNLKALERRGCSSSNPIIQRCRPHILSYMLK